MRTSAGFLEIGLSGKMRIQMRPPRLMWRVMARRAASICRAVSRPRPIALRPNSPNETLAPTVATPLLRPFCSLRYFLLAGCSMFHSCFLGFARFCSFRHLNSGLFALAEHFAFEHKHFHANDAVGGSGLRKTVVNVGAQRMERHTALAVPLGARNFGPIQAA